MTNNLPDSCFIRNGEPPLSFSIGVTLASIISSSTIRDEDLFDFIFFNSSAVPKLDTRGMGGIDLKSSKTKDRNIYILQLYWT